MGRHKALGFKAFLLLLALLLTACPLLNNPPKGGSTPTFDISLSLANLTIAQGDSGTTQLTITPKDGFSGRHGEPQPGQAGRQPGPQRHHPRAHQR